MNTSKHMNLLLNSAVISNYKEEAKMLIPIHVGRSCIKCGSAVTNVSKKQYGQKMYPQWYKVRGNTFQCSKCYNKAYWRMNHQ